MIKPFKVLWVRDEPNGAKTACVSVRKVEQLSETRRRTEDFQTAIYVDAGLDVDDVVYDYLKKGGWIDA
jgi:hypothetical protein